MVPPPDRGFPACGKESPACDTSPRLGSNHHITDAGLTITGAGPTSTKFRAAPLLQISLPFIIRTIIFIMKDTSK